MTREQLDAIRARVSEFVPTHHHEEGDPFYSCPEHPKSMSNQGPGCLCDYEEQAQRRADLDALLAEVTALRAALEHVAPDGPVVIGGVTIVDGRIVE